MEKFFNILRFAFMISFFTFMLYTSYKDVYSKTVSIDVINIDAVSSKYITEKRIKSIILENTSVFDSAFYLESFSGNQIEKILKKNELIKEAEVYVDNQGRVAVNIITKTPFVHIITDASNYYLDDEGQVLSCDLDYKPRTPLFNGNINSDDHLSIYEFAKIINSDPFWLSQITQIYLLNKKAILVPRVGDHKIHFGILRDIDVKLDNLYQFYKQVNTLKGWGSYTDINLEYNNQIICTKK
tara:strand:+ start:522 stop:1244 length:723 start_codon:yes stop_codon:yes gene_type:complete